MPILCNARSPRSLSENAAVTIGRIGLVCPAPIAPHLEHFAKQWCVSTLYFFPTRADRTIRCTALWEIKDNDEKDSAFRGFCMLIQANPAGIQKDYLWFCNAVCKWQRPSPELNDMFHKVRWGEETRTRNPLISSFRTRSWQDSNKCWATRLGMRKRLPIPRPLSSVFKNGMACSWT